MAKINEAKQEFLKDPSKTVADIMAMGYSKTMAYEAHSRAFQKKPHGHKRVVAISDLHCGHVSGLTPPEWFAQPTRKNIFAQQKEAWDWYKHTVKGLGKVDVLFVLADCIDGKGHRSGGTELITANLMEQTEIATRCIEEINFVKVYFVYGTPYHVAGDGEDFELLIAKNFNAEIGNHIWVDVNGVVFDLKHKIGGSTIPHGRFTALAKEALWNEKWARIEGAPHADIFLRGHVHYCACCEDETFQAMTLPALQTPNTKYGASQCSGTVDFGLVHFDVPDDATLSDVKRSKHIYRLKEVAPKIIVA